MSWICPKCKRKFKNIHQSHSCVNKSLEEHFLKKETRVRTTYYALERKLKSVVDFRIHPVINAIMFATDTTFLAIKPKKSWIDLEFVLDYEVNEFPIHKTVKISKTRFAHFIRIQEPKDIDDQLTDWIVYAFHLISKNG